MKFTVIGTSEFTLAYTNALLEKGGEICSIISLPKHALPLNSANICGFAMSHNIDYHEFKDINSPEAVETMKNQKPDYIFSSWPKIIEKDVLNIPKSYCIGTHPTELPHNRGRHPLHWLIALGIPESKLSFFRMDEGVDSGKILLQVPYPILPRDSIKELVSRVNMCAYEGTKILYDKLNASFQGVEQKNENANYWRKRNPYDTLIDLRMPAELISRLVRSYAPPYNCASLIFEDEILHICSLSVINMDLSGEELKRLEPGKIIGVDGRKIRIKTDDLVVELECAKELPSMIAKRKYIFPPSKYIADFKNLEERLR